MAEAEAVAPRRSLEEETVERRRLRIARRLSHSDVAPADGCSGANPGLCTPCAVGFYKPMDVEVEKRRQRMSMEHDSNGNPTPP